MRAAATVAALASDLPRAARLGARPWWSLLLCWDVVLYRVLRAVPGVMRATPRRVRLAGGLDVYFRRNRGDLHAFREVWLYEAYRLPFDLEPRTVIDLGANIGLTSLWLSKRYNLDCLVAVEPSASNVAVLRQNLTGAHVTVIHAAVGPDDGEALFAESSQSHLGRVAAEGHRVRQISMHTLLAGMPAGSIVDLLKVDIEGAEGALFAGDITWLRRVRSIIMEIHPPMVDLGDIVQRICHEGFRHFPAGSVWPETTDAFVRLEG